MNLGALPVCSLQIVTQVAGFEVGAVFVVASSALLTKRH